MTTTTLLSLVLVGTSALALGAGEADDAPKPVAKSETHVHHWHSRSRTEAEVHANVPLKDLREALDARTGSGLGLRWTKDRSNGHGSRTRLEWNVFPESRPLGSQGLKTQVSNYVLSFDHLYRFGREHRGPYLMGGVGAVRWFVDETAPGAENRFHTTKLGLSAGVGMPMGENFGAEVRYVLSSYRRNQDANYLQVALSWRF